MAKVSATSAGPSADGATSSLTALERDGRGRSEDADLYIGPNDISVYPASIKVNETGFITAKVGNKGNTSASLVNVSFRIDDSPLGSPVILPVIRPNSTDNATKRWRPSSAGDHVIGIVVDDGNRIAETDEGNNRASRNVFVATAGNIPPRINITDPREGEVVRGATVVSGTASDSQSDNNELEKVEVRIDEGIWEPAEGLNAWEYSWDTTPFPDGRHDISVRASDGEEYSTVQTVGVIVDNNITNQPPIAIVSEPRSGDKFSVNETIMFRGNASYDPDKGPEPLNYTWETGDGAVLYGAFVNYSYGEKTQFVTIVLTVYDGDRENENQATVHISIHNTPPVAVAESSETAVDLGTVITFNGTGSYDPDEPLDYLANYSWDMGNGEVLFGPVVNYSYEEGGGEYVVKLTVFDRHNASDNDTLVITLNNTIPVADLRVPSNLIDVDTAVLFDGGYSYDPDGNVVEYLFDMGDGHNTGWIERDVYGHAYGAPGKYAPRLKVKDEEGGISLWNSIDVTVRSPPNDPPFVEIESPLRDAVVTSPLIVEGSCTDPDSDKIAQVEARFADMKVPATPRSNGTLKEWRAVFEDIGDLSDGIYRIKVRGYDGKAYSPFVVREVFVNNTPPKSVRVEPNVTAGVFPGGNISVEGNARYDTGVAVAEGNVTVEFLGESFFTVTDGAGLFSFEIPAPNRAGSHELNISVKGGGLAGVAREEVRIYEVDYSVEGDPIELYRGEERIVGYNDAVREGETVEMRISISFLSDAPDGPEFRGTVEVSTHEEGEGEEERKIVLNETLTCVPDAGEQTREFSREWSPSRGTHVIEVRIFTLYDTAPRNNNASRTVTVREELKLPDYSVVSMDLPERDIRAGEEISISIKVENSGEIAGRVNLSLYEEEVDPENLVGSENGIYLKPGASQTVVVNWRAKQGSILLVAKLDSTSEELTEENNRLVKNVKGYPPEMRREEQSYVIITTAVIGGVLVVAVAAWVYYRKKEEEDKEEKGTLEEGVEFELDLDEKI